jgi:AhpC/TSA family
MKRFTHSVPIVPAFVRALPVLPALLSVLALSACSGKSGAGAPEAGAPGLGAAGGVPGAGGTSGLSSGGTSGLSSGGTSGASTASYPPGPYGVGVGKVVENATFYGYPSASSMVRQTVSLGDYYNPDGTKLTSAGAPITALLVTVGAVWCNPCQQEAGVLGAVANKFMPAGVQVIQDLFEGTDATTGTAATESDLDSWITSHALPFPVFIDPSKKLAPYFDVSSLPFIMLLDAKTMTNVEEEVGFGGQAALEAFICTGAPQKLSVCP